MYQFKAVNAKQLDLCLKMLYAERIQPTVLTVENEKHKIEYHIQIKVKKDQFMLLDERYRILIS